MEFIGESNGYMLYRNKEGFIEAYKKKGKRIVNGQDIGTGLSHVVTNCKTEQEFNELMSANSVKKSSLPPSQPELFTSNNTPNE